LRDLPLPVAVFLTALLLPPELSVNFGELRLSGYRIVLLLLFLPCLMQLLNSTVYKITPADWGMLFMSLWCVSALAFHHGLLEALEKGGILIVEMLGAYLLARIYIRNYGQMLAVSKFFVFLVAVVLAVSIPESLTGNHFLRGPIEFIYPKRMGLHRAYGPFDHPILLGVFCAASFSYAYYLVADGAMDSVSKFFVIFVVCTGTFFSLSAGPFVALGMQLGFVVWEKMSRSIPGRWWLVFGFILLVYIAIDILSNRSPIAVLVSHLSFSGQTAYFRILIFEYGSAEVIRHPLLGIGHNPWVRPDWMPSSVDNFWLLTAMRYGLPATLALLAVMAYMVITLGNKKSPVTTIRNAGRAWGFTIGGLALVGCTVTFWNSMFVLFFFLLGTGCWLMAPGQIQPAQSLNPVNTTLTQRPKQRLF
jgi:hypothetical protein